MSRNQVVTTSAPAALGPYSQAIEIDGFVFCSGQLGIDPATGKLVDGIEAQAERALLNLEGVLGAVGLDFGDVIKVTVFITDMANFAAMNAVYAKHVVAPAPARSTVQISAIALNAMVEIEAIARRSS
jgi:2-iminobutanoate/2-iminopropanoate deaminase